MVSSSLFSSSKIAEFENPGKENEEEEEEEEEG